MGLSDQLEALLIPSLIAQLRIEAPGIIVMTRTTSRGEVFDMIDDGTIDFAIGSFSDGPPWSRRSLLYEEHHVCCFHAGLTGIRAPISLDDYCARPHALVSRSNTTLGYLQDAFHRAGVAPHVVVTTTSFFGLLLLAAESPVITTVPSYMAARFAGQFELVVSALPFAPEPFLAELLWHQRTDADLASVWFRKMVRQSAAAVEALNNNSAKEPEQ